MKTRKEVKLLVDCDDTIVDLMPRWLELYHKEAIGGPNVAGWVAKTLVAICDWELEQYFDFPDTLWRVLPEALLTAAPKSEVLDIIKSVADQVTLVTTVAKKCDPANIISSKHVWLNQNWPEWRKGFCLSDGPESRAYEFHHDVLIDDNPHNVEAWLASRPDRTAVLIDMPWNRDWKSPEKFRYCNWSGADNFKFVLDHAIERHLELVNSRDADVKSMLAVGMITQNQTEQLVRERINNPDQTGKSGGVKHDEGKAPLWWVPRPAMDAIANVMQFGANKYAAHNWRKGMKWTRLASAALRHLTAWTNGQDKDPETGMSHLWHAICCLAFLVTYETDKLGEDDRGF